MSRQRVLVLLFIFSLLIPAAAFADQLRGHVVDPQGRAVAGASILLLHGNTVAATATTAGDGAFGPIALPAGAYDVVVVASGFRGTPASATLTAGHKTVDVRVALSVSAVSESVVVSASQVETPLSRVPDSVTVIDRQDLDLHQIATVADAVRFVPGIGVASGGAPGALTSFFPRGGDSKYTLVLVDGVPQNTFGGGFDAAHLGTADIDHIEVVRGPESALFGDGATGAVVQVITRHGGPLRANASFEGGGYGLSRETGAASGSRGLWGWSGAFERLESTGDTRVMPSIGRRVANDDYTRTNGSGAVSWSDKPGRSLRFDLRGGTNDVGNPGPYGSDPLHLYSGLDLVSRGHNQTVEVGGSASLPLGTRVSQKIQANWADLKSHYTSPFGPSDDATRRGGVRYQMDVQATPSLGVSAGGEVLRERADNTYITGVAGTAVPIKRVVSGLFVEARSSFSGRGFVNVGARVERIERTALEADAFGPRPAFANDVVWSANPKGTAAWFLREPDANGWTKLHAGAGTGIRPPTAFEIAFTNNPSLKPERSESFDFGIEQAAAKSRVVFDATWFHNRYRDLIVSVGSSFRGASRYQTDNIANARAEGLELGARWRGPHGVGARVAYTWLDTSVLGVTGAPSAAPSPYAVGDALVRRPRHQGVAELTWTGSRSRAFITAGGRGRMLDIEPNYASSVFNSPAFVVVSAGGSWTLARGVDLFARGSNLFNRQYEEALGFPALGRTAEIGLRVTHGR